MYLETLNPFQGIRLAKVTRKVHLTPSSSENKNHFSPYRVRENKCLRKSSLMFLTKHENFFPPKSSLMGVFNKNSLCCMWRREIAYGKPLNASTVLFTNRIGVLTFYVLLKEKKEMNKNAGKDYEDEKRREHSMVTAHVRSRGFVSTWIFQKFHNSTPNFRESSWKFQCIRNRWSLMERSTFLCLIPPPTFLLTYSALKGSALHMNGIFSPLDFSRFALFMLYALWMAWSWREAEAQGLAVGEYL